jgi:hypothetical protein
MGLRSETQLMEPVAGTVGPPPRRRRTGLIVGLVAALVLLLVAGGITVFALNRGGGTASAGTAAGATTVSSPSTSPGRSTSPSSTSTSASPSAGVVPAVTGLSLAQASTAITNAGLRVKVDEVLDSTVADNSVKAQDPTEGTSLERGGTVTLTVARRPVGVYLASIPAVAYSQDNGTKTTAQLNGQTYIHAITQQTYCSQSSSLEYDLGRHYRTFTMTAGLSDDSSSAGQLQIDVTIDGRNIFSQVAKLGQPVTVSVDVTGGLRLAISATRVEPDCQNYSRTVTAVYGDPEIFGSPDEVPTASATPSN